VDEWEPISRGEIKVLDTSPTPGLIAVETKLSTTPDVSWREAFGRPADVTIPVNMRPPRIMGDTVTMEIVRADELKTMVDYVDGAIGWANQSYENGVLPRLRRQAEEKARARDTQKAEIDKARDIAKEL
jgi:hypothetical protein